MKLITTPNGQYRKCKKNDRETCDCIIGQDPNSYQPHLIKCKKPVSYIWFWRNWLGEVIKESKEPIYSGVGAACCQECFDKVKENGPPSDLEELREKWKKNKEKK